MPGFRQLTDTGAWKEGDMRPRLLAVTCTTVRLVEPTVGPTEEIAAFDCVPVRRNVVHTFTPRTRLNTEMGPGCVLMEYQFVGDTEGHGVPSSTNAH